MIPFVGVVFPCERPETNGCFSSGCGAGDPEESWWAFGGGVVLNWVWGGALCVWRVVIVVLGVCRWG